ncbi:XkdW protein [compost metagenome]
MYLYPYVNPFRDFVVQDNGAEPVLHEGAEEKGRVRYEIMPPGEGEEAVEGVHYRYGINYNLLVKGKDYEIIERGPYIAAWNLDVPQPTEVELEAAWEAYLEAESNKPPELSEVEQLLAENTALQDRLQDVEVIVAELLSI